RRVLPSFPTRRSSDLRLGVDIHRQTAALVFDVLPDEVTPQMRAAAKTINFATIYGIGPFALAQRLDTSVAEARSFIEQYFRRFRSEEHTSELQSRENL